MAYARTPRIGGNGAVTVRAATRFSATLVNTLVSTDAIRALAALVFADPHVTLREDPIDETGERRWHALGLAAGLEPILLVVHGYREESDGEEIVGIISSRKARKSERRAYFE